MAESFNLYDGTFPATKNTLSNKTQEYTPDRAFAQVSTSLNVLKNMKTVPKISDFDRYRQQKTITLSAISQAPVSYTQYLKEEDERKNFNVSRLTNLTKIIKPLSKTEIESAGIPVEYKTGIPEPSTKDLKEIGIKTGADGKAEVLRSIDFKPPRVLPTRAAAAASGAGAGPASAPTTLADFDDEDSLNAESRVKGYKSDGTKTPGYRVGNRVEYSDTDDINDTMKENLERVKNITKIDDDTKKLMNTDNVTPEILDITTKSRTIKELTLQKFLYDDSQTQSKTRVIVLRNLMYGDVKLGFTKVDSLTGESSLIINSDLRNLLDSMIMSGDRKGLRNLVTVYERELTNNTISYYKDKVGEKVAKHIKSVIIKTLQSKLARVVRIVRISKDELKSIKDTKKRKKRLDKLIREQLKDELSKAMVSSVKSSSGYGSTSSGSGSTSAGSATPSAGSASSGSGSASASAASAAASGAASGAGAGPSAGI